ncbi:MAG: GNAT family N-acetyltransferase, partial [Candidatus Thermoplasmatota archaeon]|nr:GNAT family N-acetyltransferase [Candidatus Thermoplasmatota archaeon]
MSSRGLEIRKFEESDYQEVVKLQNVISPWTKSSVESLKHLDENFPEKCKHQRYIAELDGEVIGHASYSQWEGSYEPGKFSIYGAIHPDRQGEGYGAELYQHVMKELDEYDPIKLKANTKEGKERAIRFLKDRGFREMNRVWELELDVDSFDLEKDGRSEENLDEDGIGITTLKEIGNDENNRRKIYGLFEEIMEDIPGSEEFTGMDYDQFIERIFNRPIFSPECTII